MNKKTRNIAIIAIIIILISIGVLIIKRNKEKGETATIISKDIEEREEDKSAVTITEDTEIKNNKITKTGDSSDLQESDKTGKNSAILTEEQKELTIENSEITTNGSGASGVAATNKSKVEINNSNITTNAERSKGLLASGGGKITAKNLKIKTSGDKSSGAVTDTGGGNLKIEDSTIETTGVHSAGIYSTDRITAKNVNIKTEQSTTAVIDGTGRMDLYNCNLISGGKRTIYIYCTGEGKSSIKGQFTMRGGSLTSQKGPVFYVTNTTAEIELDNVEINAQNGILLKAITDNSDLGMEYENKSEKGGDVVITARDQKLEGGFVIDKESTLNLTLESGSTLKGYINKENTAKNVKLTVEDGCTIELTENCYVDELNISKNAIIIENGFKIIQK